MKYATLVDDGRPDPLEGKRLLKIDGGTPANHGGKSLCESCKHSHVMRGFKDSQLVIMCGANKNTFGDSETYYPGHHRVPFLVSACSGYNDKREVPLEAMKRLALIVEPCVRIEARPPAAVDRAAEIIRDAAKKADEAPVHGK
jgi:hypothetical protein